MALQYRVDPTVALIKGFDRFVIELTNWGNDGTSEDAHSQNTGPMNFSLAGLAIHPDSDVDAFTVLTKPAGNSFQVVSVETPYIGDIPGIWQGGALKKSRFSDLYLPVGLTTGATFGYGMGGVDPVFGGVNGSVTVATYPRLVVIAYLRPPLMVSLARGPIYDKGDATVGGVPRIVRVLAVPGRKRLRVVFKRRSAAGSCDVQLTGALGGSVGTAAVTAIAEFELTTAQTLAAAGDQVTFDLALPPSIYWVMLKVMHNSGSPQIDWRLEGY